MATELKPACRCGQGLAQHIIALNDPPVWAASADDARAVISLVVLGNVKPVGHDVICLGQRLLSGQCQHAETQAGDG